MSKLTTFVTIFAIVLAIYFYYNNKWNVAVHHIPSDVKLVNRFMFMNCYLYRIQNTSNYILIDTLEEGSDEYILNKVKSTFDISPDKIKLIYITHRHRDHAGSAAALIKKLNVPTYLHPSEIEIIEQSKPQFMPQSIFSFANAIRQYVPGQVVSPFKVTYKTDTNVELKEFGNVKIVEVPGHTRGHTALVTPDGHCFIGDLMSGGLASVFDPGYPYFYEMNLRVIYESLEKVMKENCQWFYVGHGLPFRRSDLVNWMNENKKPEHYL
jgi:glyoxylase-like metal-dependent hydrolase (beta-lactamase superfamily II)